MVCLARIAAQLREAIPDRMAPCRKRRGVLPLDPPPIAPRWPRAAFTGRLDPREGKGRDWPPRGLKSPFPSFPGPFPVHILQTILHTIPRILAIWPMGREGVPRQFSVCTSHFFFFQREERAKLILLKAAKRPPKRSRDGPGVQKPENGGNGAGIGADIGSDIGPGNEGQQNKSISLTIPLHPEPVGNIVPMGHCARRLRPSTPILLWAVGP